MRLRLVHALFDGEKNVNALAEVTGGSQTNVSRHLQTLTQANVLARRKDGLQVFYSIADPSIFKLCELVCGSLEKQLAKQAGAFAGGAIADKQGTPLSATHQHRSKVPSRTVGAQAPSPAGQKACGRPFHRV